MTNQTLSQYTKLLRADRARLTDALARIAHVAVGANADADESPSNAPGDDAVAGAVGAAAGDDAAIAARESVALREIDDTLQLIAAHPDRYGICVACGRRIGSARLELIPTSRYCERHAPSS